jgi:hypothetical protein
MRPARESVFVGSVRVVPVCQEKPQSDCEAHEGIDMQAGECGALGCVWDGLAADGCASGGWSGLGDAPGWECGTFGFGDGV